VTFDPFTIVATPFPLDGGAAAQRRPALIVSTAGFNEGHGAVLLAMITASTSGAWPSDTPLRDWRQAGLPMPCRVRLKLFTFDTDRLFRRIGILTAYDRRIVSGAISGALAKP
jgi:mRNA interferase MazF